MYSNKMDSNQGSWSTDKSPGAILGFAREMRKNPTEAENLLWENLRNKKLGGLKFRRQQPMEGFILDFYCHEVKLGVEVHGPDHHKTEQKKYDELRTSYLEEFGIEIIRFSNEEVTQTIRNVLGKIREVTKRKLEESPSPRPRSSVTPFPGERGVGEGLAYFKLKGLLQRDQWISPAFVGVDNSGIIKHLSSTSPSDGFAMDTVDGYAIPGFQNAHSHAFQYGMAGLAENHPMGTRDDFWSWREAMYQCALSVDPDQAEAIATMLYSEMVRHGYTQVAEFHYLHHDKEGHHYNNLAELGERMVAAAQRAGIKITLVPVFYQKGTFGKEPQPRQRRFISKSVDEYLQLFEASKKVIKHYNDASLAFSIHSLRAVDLNDIIKTIEHMPSDLPFHIHVAEQKKEVADCIDHCGKRPMQWVLDHLSVDERFHLVHSTHLDDDELSRLAKSGASVVLCPSTEGNLGDGIFRMKEFVKLGGRWSIGTDSHIGINPLEEFRMIDYRQRLVSNERNTFDGDAAHYMINEEVVSGRKAMGINSIDNFEIGKPFDALIFNAKSPLVSATSLKNLVSTIVYSADSNYNLGTIINGRWVVKNNKHRNEEAIRNSFTLALQQMKNR